MGADPVSIGLMVGSTMMSLYGQHQQNKAVKSQAAFEKAQYDQQAGQTRASAQRASMEERRKAGLVQSKARAGLAAGGGLATDPTALDIQSEIEAEGEYRSLTQLYEGENRARGLEDQGNMKVYDAKNKAQAGKIGMMNTVMSNGSSIYNKFGPAGAAANKPTYGSTITNGGESGMIPYGSMDTGYDMPWLRYN